MHKMNLKGLIPIFMQIQYCNNEMLVLLTQIQEQAAQIRVGSHVFREEFQEWYCDITNADFEFVGAINFNFMSFLTSFESDFKEAKFRVSECKV